MRQLSHTLESLAAHNPMDAKGLKRFEDDFFSLPLLLRSFVLAQRNRSLLKLRKLTYFPFRLFSLFFLSLDRVRAYAYACGVFRTHAGPCRLAIFGTEFS